jgi:hypothetical protein
MKPSIGRIVHFVQKALFGDGVVYLPAIVTAVWGESCVNLQVFTDGTISDDYSTYPIKWFTSVSLDASDNPQPRTWHWPETIAPQPAAPALAPVEIAEPESVIEQPTKLEVVQPAKVEELQSASAQEPIVEQVAQANQAEAQPQPAQCDYPEGYEIAGGRPQTN